MNFLAHLHLSPDDSEAMIGNMLADFVKGPDVEKLPPVVRAGVRQHRLVDGFTDRHAVVHRSISRINREWHWFSGIIIDVYYDHLLARTWDRYSTAPLRAFADRAYEVIRRGMSLIPAGEEPFFHNFVRSDRLVQ